MTVRTKAQPGEPTVNPYSPPAGPTRPKLTLLAQLKQTAWIVIRSIFLGVALGLFVVFCLVVIMAVTHGFGRY